MGFEPTDNGFANRRPEHPNDLSRQHLAQSTEGDLALRLARVVRQHPELSTLIEAWPALSAEAREAVLQAAGIVKENHP